jgi:hypothetical protein
MPNFGRPRQYGTKLKGRRYWFGDMIYSLFSIYKYIHTDRFDIRHGPLSVACTNVCKAWAKSDKNWQFWKNDLDLNMFDLQHLERSLHQGHVWPAHVIASQIRSLDDDWFKTYAHICEKFVYFLWPWPWSNFYQMCDVPCLQLNETN